MIKKGIILSGGLGTRLSPLTKVSNKQLLPLYDKPMIFYSLSLLMLARIKDILIITNKSDVEKFKHILSNGKDLGIKISYLQQEKPNGLPEAFIIGEKFINKKSVALILGDNFFYGQGFQRRLIDQTNLTSGAKIFLYPVKNVQDYGIAELKGNKIKKISEKPKKTKSNLAITGLYFFDKNVCKYSKSLSFSKRGELEITDLLKKYLKNKKLKYELMGRGSAWLDTGSYDNLLSTSEFISTIEKRQGLKIGCIEEVAFRNRWINKSKLNNRIKFYGNCEYSKYLKKIISNE